MRLYITGYYQGEYMYMLTKEGLVMNHKEYSIAKNLKKNLKIFLKNLFENKLKRKKQYFSLKNEKKT